MSLPVSINSWNGLFKNPEKNPVPAKLKINISDKNRNEPEISIEGQITKDTMNNVNLITNIPPMLRTGQGDAEHPDVPTKPFYYDIDKFLVNGGRVQNRNGEYNPNTLDSTILKDLQDLGGFYILEEKISSTIRLNLTSDIKIIMQYSRFGEEYTNTLYDPAKIIPELASANDFREAISKGLLPKGNVNEFIFNFSKSKEKKRNFEISLSAKWIIGKIENPLVATVPWTHYPNEQEQILSYIKQKNSMIRKFETEIKTLFFSVFEDIPQMNDYYENQNTIIRVGTGTVGLDDICKPTKPGFAQKTVSRNINIKSDMDNNKFIDKYQGQITYYPPNRQNPGIGWPGTGILLPNPTNSAGIFWPYKDK